MIFAPPEAFDGLTIQQSNKLVQLLNDLVYCASCRDMTKYVDCWSEVCDLVGPDLSHEQAKMLVWIARIINSYVSTKETLEEVEENGAYALTCGDNYTTIMK